ncbi:hypothetical protein BDZ90DRAFT_231954 [Jaminaea rosea]|uniref:Uncharacterized protein n=1 Tax=Jaminaea rosea TaxID=1569628 RepID=A0A316UYH8_9BASI|nr:hypothetical protein BDZ90DRAFT_231954 [Jaminaea rosea]PWN28195.1 hypothetical protein BDZ90DRAFT_231954 [Jaminaea rosea]
MTDADSSSGSIKVHNNADADTSTSSTGVPRTLEDLQHEVYALFQQFVDDDEDTKVGEPSPSSPSLRTVALRDLPRLLNEFERKRGTPLVEDESRAQLEEFCQQMPDQTVACDDLAGMIFGLESARTATAAAPTSSSDDGESEDDAETSNSESSLSPSSTNNELPRADVPRSFSHSMDMTIGASGGPKSSSPSRPPRNRTTSASAADISPAKGIIKGKGSKAPPSSWSRPRPQALAGRNRRTSETSQEIGDRRASQPYSGVASSDVGGYRSTSAGYVFPRASSPGDDEWYAEQHARHIRNISNASRGASVGVGGGGGSRPASPELDHQSFHAFAALGSPISPAPGSAAGKSAAGEGAELESLQRRYDNLVRVLQEKERSFESTQNSQETTIADLDTQVEQLRERIHTLTKSNDEQRTKERRYLDEISRLEGDLATSQKRGDHAERVKEVMQQDLAHRETTIVNLQGKINDLLERVATAERDEADHYGRAQALGEEAEGLRTQIEQLRGQVRAAVEKEAKIEELESEREALRAQMRDLHLELEEARRGSGFLPAGQRGLSSQPSTIGGKAGASLGSELKGIFRGMSSVDETGDVPAEGSGGRGRDFDGEQTVTDSDVGSSTTDPDASMESVVVTTTRRRRRAAASSSEAGGASSSSREYRETQSQTEQGTGSGHLAPPSYDEAATEKIILERLHPAPEAGSGPLSPTSLVDVIDTATRKPDTTLFSQYEAMAHKVGVRCTVLEDALRRQPTEAASGGGLTSTILQMLPPATQLRLRSIAQTTTGTRSADANRRSKASSVSTTQWFCIWTGSVMLVGVLIGMVLISQQSPSMLNTATNQHGTQHDPWGLGVGLDSSLDWHTANSLNYGVGSTRIEYAGHEPASSALAKLMRMLYPRARVPMRPRGVPI